MAWGFVQSWGGQGVGVTTLSETSTSGLTSGTKMVAVIATDQAGTANFGSATVKDGAGNSFTQAPNSPVAQGGSNGAVAVYFLDTPAGDAGSVCIVTLAGLSTASAVTMIVEEWSGLLGGNTSAIFDGTPSYLGASTTGNVGPPTNPTSYASTAPSELLLYVFGDDGFGATVTPPAGYTADPKNELGSTNSNIAVAYKNSTGGTETGTWNVASSDDWAMFMVAVQVAGTAAPPAASVPQAQPGKTWQRRFHHRQIPAALAAAANMAVTGLTAAAALAAPAGAVTAGATVNGTVSSLTLAAPAGTVTAGAAVTGVTAALTLTAPAGTVTAGATVTGVTATLTLNAPAGTAAAGTGVTGTTATLALAAPAGSVTAGAAVTGAAVTMTLAAPAGSLAIAVPGIVTTLTLNAPAGTVQAGATITGLPAAMTLNAPAGAVSAGQGPAGTPATLALAAPAGTVAAGGVVTGTTATLTLTAPAGTVQASAAVTGVTAALAVAAPPGTASTFSGGLPLSAVLLGGTITPAAWGGIVTTQAYAGSVTPAAWAASVTTLPYSGTITGGIVGVQSDLQAIVSNDEYFYLALTYNGAALNLTGYTLKAYLKATRLTPDSEAVVFTTSSGLTVTNVSGGLVTWDIPHTDLPNPTNLWYRVDVIDASSEVFTCLFGNVQVQPA